MSADRVWTRDQTLGDEYECTTLPLAAEDDGTLCATLVRRREVSSADTDHRAHPRRAVLYVHGFVDYFFHTHLADACTAAGWNFYAIDLRRYGRSIRDGNRPNYCTDLAEYDAELTAAIDVVRDEDDHATLALLGHSTGGLIAAWYMHRGARRAQVQALVLNSPFLDFNVPAPRSLTIPLASAIGAMFPTLSDPNAITRWYGESLLAQYHGAWTYDLRWKPLLGFPAYFGWARAIRTVQQAVARGLSIASPVLLLHAGASRIASRRWEDAYLNHDIVLNVAHMKERGPRLGADVSLHECAGGMHDLFLSSALVREAAMSAMLRWLETRCGPSATVSSTPSHHVERLDASANVGTNQRANHA